MSNPFIEPRRAVETLKGTAGARNGNRTDQNIRQREAPSMRAASVISAGVDLRPARKMSVDRATHFQAWSHQDRVDDGDAERAQQGAVGEQVPEVGDPDGADRALEAGPVGEGVDEVEQRGHEEEDQQDEERRRQEPHRMRAMRVAAAASPLT